MKSQFLLDNTITYLNHGSFGACPKVIFDDYQKWQLELEREPVQFIINNSHAYLKASKEALGKYLNCRPEDFYYATNPTTAINTVMRSLHLKADDEILATNQEYGAMDKTWHFYSKKVGVKYVTQNISLPIISKEQILHEFWKGYNSKTKVVFLNQISSPTGLIFPVQEICDKARSLGLITIIDGAHVPGHIPLDIQKLDPDFYTGALHKWMLAPKGTSFLYVKKELQSTFDPLVVSWGYESDAPSESPFLDYNEQQGTRDISAFLTLPTAIQFLSDNDWETKSNHCKSLVLNNYKRFCDLLKTKPICPVTSEFLGQMCSIPIVTENPLALKELLFKKYRIEVPIMNNGSDYYLRISVQVYNSQEDLDLLYEAIEDIIATTTLLKV